MSHRSWRAACLAAALAACSAPDRQPTRGEPLTGPDQIETGPAPSRNDPDRERHERLAQRLAKALRDPVFRESVYREIGTSTFPEHKVHLQGFLNRDGGAARRRLASLAAEQEDAVTTDLDQSGAVEVYFPVPGHRAQWNGGSDLLVATAETDADRPVAWDLMGRRHQLSQQVPPALPVLMVSRAEQSFDPRPVAVGEGLIACGGGGGGGGGSPPPPALQGLFMTQTSFSGTFESWFKGNPEFEVHVLGQAGTGSALTTYQCAGEYGGGPYTFDQNGTTWSGNVMLMSQTQLDQYKLQHPGQNLRIFVVEDDDTACEIKIDSTRTANLFKSIKLVYGDLTGGSDSTGAANKFFRKAPMLLSLVKAITSFFKTNDDPVGNAVEDPYAAAAYFPGANWVIRGENSTLNGAIRLEIR